jgi:hypothetical protein
MMINQVMILMILRFRNSNSKIEFLKTLGLLSLVKTQIEAME